jgi:hypothetical protein
VDRAHEPRGFMEASKRGPGKYRNNNNPNNRKKNIGFRVVRRCQHLPSGSWAAFTDVGPVPGKLMWPISRSVSAGRPRRANMPAGEVALAGFFKIPHSRF